MNDLISRLRAYIAQREKIRDGGDTVTECNGEPLTLTDLREAAYTLVIYKDSSIHSANDLRAQDARIVELEDQLEAAREDAERYRWLRDETRTNRAPHIYQYPAQSFDRPQYPHFKDVGLDAAIDAARKEARND